MKKINRRDANDRRWNVKHLKEKYHLEKVVLANHVADLDYEIPNFVLNGLHQRLKFKSLSYISLDDPFYESLIWWYQNTKGVSLKKEWIFYSYGVLFSIIAFLRMISQENDKILVNAPSYTPFVELCKRNNRKVIFQPLTLVDNNFELDLKQTEEIFQQEHPKAFIFCNPLNPTGRIWDLKTLNALAKLCSENGVLLISDEVHSDLTLPEDNFNSALKVDKKYLNSVVVCSSPTKSFNVGGANCAYTLIPNEKLRNQFYDYLGSLWLSNANIFGAEIIKVAYTKQGVDWLKTMKHNHQQNLNFVENFIQNNNLPLKILKQESGFCVAIKMLNVTSLLELQKYKDKFLEQGIIMRFSDDFFDQENYWFRLIISTDLKDIKLFCQVMKIIFRKEVEVDDKNKKNQR